MIHLHDTYCPVCASKRVDGYNDDECPEVLHLVCKECGHTWEE